VNWLYNSWNPCKLRMVVGNITFYKSVSLSASSYMQTHNSCQWSARNPKTEWWNLCFSNSTETDPVSACEAILPVEPLWIYWVWIGKLTPGGSTCWITAMKPPLAETYLTLWNMRHGNQTEYSKWLFTGGIGKSATLISFDHRYLYWNLQLYIYKQKSAPQIRKIQWTLVVVFVISHL
jgi:hypothetical protein